MNYVTYDLDATVKIFYYFLENRIFLLSTYGTKQYELI